MFRHKSAALHLLHRFFSYRDQIRLQFTLRHERNFVRGKLYPRLDCQMFGSSQ